MSLSSEHTEYSRVGSGEQGEIRDDSSTDVDELPTDYQSEEKGSRWHDYNHDPRPRQGRWRKCCSSMLLQGLLNTFLLVLVLALLLDKRWHQKRYGQLEGSGDITGFIPPASQQIRSFVPDMAFVPENGSEFFSEAVKKKWLSIVPSMRNIVPLYTPPPNRASNLFAVYLTC